MGLPYLRLRCPRKGRCSRRIATQRIWSRRTPKPPCTPCNATRRIWRETHLRHSSQDIPEHHLSTATELRLPPSLFDRQKSIRFICTPSSSVFETLILSDNIQTFADSHLRPSWAPRVVKNHSFVDFNRIPPSGIMITMSMGAMPTTSSTKLHANQE